MTERRTNTIRLGSYDYAKVATRLKEFLEDNPKDISIETSCEWKDGWVIFRAKLTCPRGVFTGHSLGQTGKKDKAFEKLETIAVGRALALSGYMASGEIASFEEMQEYEQPSAVSFADHKNLKRDWWHSVVDTVDESDAAAAFGKWAEEVAGIESFLANNPREWTPEDLVKCRQHLDQQAADALTASGLTEQPNDA